MLSDIEEADIENTVRSHRQRMEEEDIAPKYVDDNESGQDTPPPRKLTKSRFVVESAEDGSKIIIPPGIIPPIQVLSKLFRILKKGNNIDIRNIYF